ncbi:class I adenylate-forming enzyme family protein [Nocardia wallacei]|uniref:class I adenylate-forming enzyme family protein n=1 Tax=Nocardia wallacei TaxID=480035 RepID=UPI0024587306|nr:class I adenylate-forming enzyme family protein [Nocardia wallacei]
MTAPRRRDLAMRILGQRLFVNGAPLDERSTDLRDMMRTVGDAGVRPDDLVALSGLEGREFVIAVLALWYCEAIPVPDAARDAATAGAHSAWLVTGDLAIRRGRASHREPGLSSTAVVHTTSGSTGRPKFVRRGIASVLLEAAGYRESLGLGPEDRVAVPIPPAHSLGWGTLTSALLSGSAVEIRPFVRPSTLAGSIDAGSVSVVVMTPPIARLLVDTRRTGTATPRTALVGAGPVSDALDRSFRMRFGRELLRGYGSTETGGTFVGTTGIGAPLSGVRIAAPPRGSEGELLLEIAAPVEGYLDEQAPASVWNTGDVVRHEEDGTVRFVERAAGGLRLNGRFVDVRAVREAVTGVPGVADLHLLVLARPDDPDIQDFYAFVAGAASTDEVLESLTERAPGEPIPRVVRCDRIPRTVIGKPDRRAMIEMIGEGDAHDGAGIR